MIDVVISGTGLYHPEESISNDELVASFNQYVETFNNENSDAIENGDVVALKPSSAEFIEKASGIKNRYTRSKQDILDPEKMWPYYTERTDDELCIQAEAGVIAAKQALKNANKIAADIDGIIVSCTHKQRDYPSIAIEIQEELGVEGFAYDMGVACSSATFGLCAAIDSIKAGRAKAILVITPEVSIGQMSFRDRDSHFIFGEADTAVVVERADTCQSAQAFKIVASQIATKYSNNIRNNRGAFDRCCPETMYAKDKVFFQQGRKVFKEVTPMVIKFISDLLGKNDLQPSNIKRFWLHQANANMNRIIAENLIGKEYTSEQAPTVLDEFANTAGAGSVIAFHRYHQGFNLGDYGVLCSFGAGYSMGCIVLEKV